MSEPDEDKDVPADAPDAAPVTAQPAAPPGQDPSSSAAPAAPAAPAALAAPAWTPPDTFADRFSRWSTAAVRYSIAGFGLLSLVLWVLWLVPAIAVSRSSSYRVACEKVAGEPTLNQYVGEPIVCERVPTWYLVGTPQGDLFRIAGRGRDGGVLAEVRVKDEVAEVVGFYLTTD